MSEFYEELSLSNTALIIIGLALMLFCGFLTTRITKRLGLPAVTAYLLAGILIGPYCFDLVPAVVIDNMGFLSDIALCFIAFSAGEYFRVALLKQEGKRVIIIALFETVLTAVAVFAVTFFLLRLSLALSVVLSTLSAITSPTSTMMIIRQTRAKGEFVNTLMLVVAIDLILGITLYSVGLSASSALLGGKLSAWDIVKPVLTNLGVMALGGIFGVLMKLLIPQSRSKDNRLIILLALLFAFCGACALLGVSPLLGCMAMGAVYINLSGNEKLFKQINYFSPPFLLLFFVKSGIQFDFNALVAGGAQGGVPLIVVALLYLIIRMAGKYCGAAVGCVATKKKRNISSNLGLALIPQAGVAIALSATGARALGGEVGVALETVIVAAGLIYELIGPALTKLSLSLSGSLQEALGQIAPVEETAEDGRQKSEVELLVERINAIRAQNHYTVTEENEDAFVEELSTIEDANYIDEIDT